MRITDNKHEKNRQNLRKYMSPEQVKRLCTVIPGGIDRNLGLDLERPMAVRPRLAGSSGAET